VFCRADWEACASKGVVEKSVGMFKRAKGGWVEYGRSLGLLQILCRIRGTEENNRLENDIGIIRILCETPYNKKQRAEASPVLYCYGRKAGPRIAVLYCHPFLSGHAGVAPLER
jgi:hypothetical protein